MRRIGQKTHLHPVASEVDAQRRLRELGRHLLGGQLHLPGPVGVAVEAEVLLIGVALLVEAIDVCGSGGF